eukprot:248738_1
MAAIFALSLSILVSICLSQPPPPQFAYPNFLENKDAVCLDGTPGVFYMSNGTESSKYVIYFQGGGFCPTLSQPPEPRCFDDCYSRSQTPHGSTQHAPPKMDLNHIGNAVYLSNNKSINPLMANWNHIVCTYCDGGFFAGNKSQPDIYNNTKIYYRGAVILYEIIQTLLNKYNMVAATDIVFAGTSAGGQAVYININQLDAWMNLGNKVNIYTIADSGFIIDDAQPINNYTNMDVAQKDGYYLHNMAGNVPAKCKSDMQSNNMDPYHCAFPQYNIKYVNENINFFALQGQFDSFQINCVLGTNTHDNENIQSFGMYLENLVNMSLLVNKANHGAMIDSCEHHCGGWTTINLNGVTQCDAFTEFYNNKQKQRVWYQNETYPCESCCG